MGPDERADKISDIRRDAADILAYACWLQYAERGE